MLARTLGYVLMVANSNPPSALVDWNCTLKDLFYRAKDIVLRRFGTLDVQYNLYGDPDPIFDYQKMTRSCWSCHKGIWHRGRHDEDVCWKCNGTGVYEIRYVQLERWRIGGYTFHRPAGSVSQMPGGRAPDIVGLVKHEPHKRAWWACLLLGLLFYRRLSWCMLGGMELGKRFGAVRWWLRPLTREEHCWECDLDWRVNRLCWWTHKCPECGGDVDMVSVPF